MLSIFRRHTRACTAKRRQHDRAFRKCKCTIHAEGAVGKEYVRESLKTRNWDLAQRRIAEAEARGAWRELSGPHTSAVRTAAASVSAFLTDAASQKGRALAAPTLSKYRTLFGRLEAFCEKRDLVALEDLTPEVLREFKETWPTGPRATGNNVSRLRSFFRFCLENEWIARNPALALRRAKHVQEAQKLPFAEDEMERIASAARDATRTFVLNFLLETLILVMRHTGLRISDAAMLKAERIQGEELQLHTQKTGTWVSMPLEPQLLNRLRRIRARADGYLFVTGASTRMETVTDLWRRKINRVFTAARIQYATPHRFRHTFAVELLSKGVDVKYVSQLLGHSSVTITEKFYAAWVPKRQQVLNQEIRRSWAIDAGATPRRPPGSARPDARLVRCINE
jgi:integrase/recombinase XerD